MAVDGSNGEFNFDEEIDRRKECPQTLKWHKYLVGEDGEHLFPAGVADMDFKAPPVVRDALQRRLDHGVFGYEEDPEGLDEAVVAWHRKRHGWNIDSRDWAILRSPNVLTSLAVASMMIAEGEGIIVQPPVFFDFFDVILENKRKLVKNPLIFKEEVTTETTAVTIDGEPPSAVKGGGRYYIDFAGLEEVAQDPSNTMLYFCNPHNPIGRVWTKEELSQVADICRRNNVLIVSDEIHADVIYSSSSSSTHNESVRGGYTPFGVVEPKNIISCISPAKSFNIASVCYSFTIIPDADLRKRFQAENSRYSFNKNNAFSSAAMEAAYRDGEPWLDACVKYLGGNLDVVRTSLSQLPATEKGPVVRLVEPDATFLLWIDFRGLKPLGIDTDEALTKFLGEKAEWSITRGISFGEEGSMFGRLNIACPRARLQKALDKLGAAIRLVLKETGKA